jgi:hypothetical protein
VDVPARFILFKFSGHPNHMMAMEKWVLSYLKVCLDVEKGPLGFAVYDWGFRKNDLKR